MGHTARRYFATFNVRYFLVDCTRGTLGIAVSKCLLRGTSLQMFIAYSSLHNIWKLVEIYFHPLILAIPVVFVADFHGKGLTLFVPDDKYYCPIKF